MAFPASPLLVVIAYWLSSQNHHKAAKLSAEMAEKSLEQNDRRAVENTALQREMASTTAENQRINTKFTFDEQRRQNKHPLIVPSEDVDAMAPEKSLRMFIAPPRHLLLRGLITDAAWQEIHSDQLDYKIQSFRQNYFDVTGPRPVFVYGRGILNAAGLRGSEAVYYLQKELSARPTVYLQSDRISAGSCGFGLASWTEMPGAAAFRIAGEVPSFDLAARRLSSRNMALSLLFRRQKERMDDNEAIQALLRKHEEQGAKSPLHRLFLSDDLLHIKQALAAEGDAPAATLFEPTHPDLNDPELIERAVDHLANGYKMLIAAAADMHFLSEGIAPVLPQLVARGEFDLGDQYNRVAVAQLLSYYVSTSALIAEQKPARAPEIYLGLAESVLPIGQREWTEGLLLEAVNRLRSDRTAPDGALDAIPAVIEASDSPGQSEWVRRLCVLLGALGHRELAAAVASRQHANDLRNGGRLQLAPPTGERKVDLEDFWGRRL